jgi:FkbM family methyltransferase
MVRKVEFTVRTKVACVSALLSLFKLTHYSQRSIDLERLRRLFAEINWAIRRGKPDVLNKEVLFAYGASGVQALSIDGSNTQFISGCVDVQQFKYGHEPEILAALAALMPKDGVFLDVGANWGQFAVHLLLDPTFVGKTAAIEPVGETFRDLKNIVSALGFTERCRLFQIAAGENRGIAQITPDALSGMQTIHGAVTEGEIVRVERLDDLNLPPAHFIKIDVENHETEVLRGARAYLSSSNPVVIFENWLTADLAQTWMPFGELEAMGYHCFAPKFIPASLPETELPMRVMGELHLTPITKSDRMNQYRRLNVVAIHQRKLPSY